MTREQPRLLVHAHPLEYSPRRDPVQAVHVRGRNQKSERHPSSACRVRAAVIPRVAKVTAKRTQCTSPHFTGVGLASPVRVQLDSLPAGRAHLGHDKENQEARGAAVLSRVPGGKRSFIRQLHKASAQDEGCTASTHIRAHTNTEMRTRTFGFCVHFGVFL